MKNIALLVLSIVWSFIAMAQYNWSNVRLGGGGAIPGIIAHPKVEGLFYARTDVGSAFRWDDNQQKWEGLLNWVPDSKWWLKTAASLVVDPTDSTGNLLYAALGVYPESSQTGKCGVFKSVNRGKTWIATGLDIDFASNNDQKADERLVVDPNNGSVIFCTSRMQGTWLSTESANPGTWNKINSLNGTFIEIDKSSGIIESIKRTKIIYIGVSGVGVYKSHDGGETFQLLAGSPLEPQRAEIATSGILFVTHQSGVAKYNGANWENVTPGIAGSYLAIAVNPSNPLQLIVSRHDWSHKLPMFLSNDGGKNWKQLNVKRDVTENPWSPDWHFASSTFSFAFDPFNSPKVWFSDWYNTWETQNINADTVTWKSRSIGFENTVSVGTMVCPPTGDVLLYSGIADVGGFEHTSLSEPPTKRFTDKGLSGNLASTGVAIQESDPYFVIRVGREGWNGNGFGAYSTDGGKTYSFFTKKAGDGGRIAIASDGSSMVWATQNKGLYYSTDRGKNWQLCNGAPSSVLGGTNIFMHAQPLASDKVNGSKFYLYKDGDFFRSNDGGKNFIKAATGLPSVSNDGFIGVNTSPEIDGNIWVNLNESGLFHSINSGDSFEKIVNVQKAKLVSVGKESPVTGKPAVFVYGIINGLEGIFRSDDFGQNWVMIHSDDYMLPEAVDMAADRMVFGRVFIGTAGTGIFYGEPSGMPDTFKPSKPTNVKFSIKPDSVLLNWNKSLDQVKIQGYRVYYSDTLLAEIDSNYAVLKGLAANKTYPIKLVSVDNSGNESDGYFFDLVIEFNQPTQPGNLTAVSDRTFIQLDWSPSTDDTQLKNYEIYVNGTYAYTTIDTACLLENLIAGTEYNISVCSVDASGNRSIPAMVTTSTLSVVSNYIVNPDFERGDYAGWTGWGKQILISAGQFEGGFGVEVPKCGAAEQAVSGLIPNTTYVLQAIVKSANATSIASLGVKDYGNPEVSNKSNYTEYTSSAVQFTTGNESNSAYIYLYNTCSNSGSIFGDNFELFEGSDTMAPTIPTGLTANPAQTSVKLSWLPSVDPFGLKYYSVFKNGELLTNQTTNMSTISSLESGVDYLFEVSATDINNNESERAKVKTTTLNMVSIKQHFNGVSIYPNPFSESLYVSGTTAICLLELYDLLGNLVLSKHANDANLFLETKQFAKGIYFTHLYLKDGAKLSYKIVKE
jgi:hypothetical protein